MSNITTAHRVFSVWVILVMVLNLVSAPLANVAYAADAPLESDTALIINEPTPEPEPVVEEAAVVEEPVVTEVEMVTEEVVQETVAEEVVEETATETPAEEPVTEVDATEEVVAVTEEAVVEEETAEQAVSEVESVVEETSSAPVTESSEATQAPELSTDKEDYHPGETATIFGKLFGSLQNIVLRVFGNSEVGNYYTDNSYNVSADSIGSFQYDYQLDNFYRPLYFVEAYNTLGELLANTTFTDAAGASVDVFDQCANDDGDGYNGNPGDCSWTNGNMNVNNSTIFEEDSTVQRLLMSGLTNGVHVVTLEYQTTKGGKHAYDFLTDFNQSETWVDQNELCSPTVSTGFPLCTSAPASFSPNIPHDPLNTNGTDDTNQNIMILNGTITNISTPTLVSGSYAADSLTQVNVTFTVDADKTGSDCLNYTEDNKGVRSCPVFMAWGAHVSSQADWGEGQSAVNISGSPYHMKVVALDGGSTGNRDNQMSADALIVPLEGNIVVVKQTLPDGDPASFTFNPSWGNSFNLTDGQSNDSGLLVAGNYSVSETVPTGWSLTSTVCVSSIGDTESAGSLELDPEETITCTFNNTKLGQIIVDKVTDPSGDQQSFDFTATYGNFSLTDGATPNNSGYLNPGVYSVAETVPAGWDLTSATCSDQSSPASINLSAGETVTCTFNNQKDSVIIVEKQTLPNGDQQVFDFDLSYGDLDADLSDGQTDNSGDLNPGVYSVSENVPAGWDLTNTTCSDGSAVNSISLGAGETVTCVFTNTKRGNIIVDKVTLPAQDSQSFNFTTTGAGYSGFSLTDQAAVNNQEVVPGAYTVAEGAVAGWTSDGGVCDSGETPASLDVLPGETVTCTFTNTKLATIIIEKQTLPNGSGQSFNFTGEINASLSDGQTASTQVLPDTYYVVESVPSGWLLTDITCDDGGSSGVINEAEAMFVVSAGQTVKCTFTNTQKGHIIVDKVTDPAGDPQSFSFNAVSGNGSYVDFNLTDEAAPNDQELNPGNYSVSEFTPNGWDLTSATCVSSIQDNETIQNLELDPGETITCTFTNQKDAFIIVEKQTLPNGDQQSFDFDLSYGDGDADLADNGTDNSGDLNPGNYSVTENVPAGWDLTSAICSDGSEANAISLQAGETVTCVFTNTKRATAIVKKVMVGDTGSFDYTGTPSGTISTNNGTISAINLVPGQYQSTETLPENWLLSSITCDDDNSSGSNSTATFNLEPGETVTCTFTNTKKGTLNIVKNTIGDNGSFDFTGTGGNGLPANFNITTAGNTGSESYIVNPGTYGVAESVPANWVLDGATCDDNSPVNNIQVAPGETVTCTFTNRAQGKIKIDKVAVGGDANFGYTVTGPTASTPSVLTAGGAGTTGLITVTAGNYSVGETTVPAGWDLTNAVCDSGTPESFTVGAGDVVTCTFTNVKRGQITVIKETLPNGSGQSFNFTASYDNDGFALSDGQQDDSALLVPGNYSVSETVPAGWDLTSATCSDASDPASIDLAAGEHVTCTFTNTQRAHIIIEKNSINDSSQAFTFNNDFGNGNPATFNLTDDSTPGLPSYNAEVLPGTYAVTEDAVAGWQLEDTSCTQGETVNSIDVAPGETVTCTFTNEQLAQIILVKNTVGGNETFDFVMTGDGLPASTELTTVLGTADQTFSDLDQDNTYSILETPIPAGWALASSSCDNGDPVNNITPNAGEVITCTFTNNKPVAQIDVTPLSATNKIGDNHVITAAVQVHNGDGAWGPAADGTLVTFDITNSNGATAAFVGGNTCNTVAGACSVTINSPTTGTVSVNASSSPVVMGVELDVETDGVGENSDDAGKTYVNAKISIDPSADTNEVNDDHNFLVTVEADYGDGLGFVAVPAGTLANAIVNPATSLDTSDCTNGVDALGQCTVIVNSSVAGVFTIIARSTVVIDGVEFKLQTNGAGENSGPAVKTYVDASIALDPLEATNAINDPHTITATVTQNDGNGVDPAVGVTVTFSVTTGAATFVGNDNDCVTDGSGQCSIQIVSGTTGSNTIDATTTFSVGGVNLTRATDGDYGPDGTGPAGKDYVNARISITPAEATNQVDESHDFVVTVEEDTGSGFSPVANAVVDVDVTPAPDSLDESDCTDGTNGSGQCTATINSASAGVFTATATTTILVNGVQFVLVTDGSGDNSEAAVKTYVDAKISVDPQQATNNINDPHTITATVMEDDGLGYDPAAGETVTFTLVNNTAGAAFVGGIDTCVTDVNGQCTVDINTSTPGSVEIHASVDAVVSTEVVHRESDSTHGSSGNGNKLYVAGKIFVQKVTVGGDDSFEFDPSYTTNFFLSNGGSNDSGFLAPGNYSVAEINLLTGWDLTSATCNDDDGSDPATIVLDADEEVTCVFTNTARGKIIVEKQTLPDGSSQSFDFTASYDNDGFSLTDGTQNDSDYIVAGNYSVAETVPTGWDQTSATCSDESDPASIDLAPGEIVTCVFENTQRGHLIVEKTTLPSGDLTEFSVNAAGTGTVTGGGAGTITDANDHDYEVTPGTYSVTETVPAGWDKTGDTCQDVVVAPGETKTCTITNTKRGTITIVKDADPNDAQDFQFAGTLGAFTLDDDAGVQDAPNPGQYENIETFNNLVAGLDYTVTETLPNQYWVLDSVTCVNTADQTPYEVASTTNGVVITLAPGADVTCTYQNDKISPTRTQGFWQTHTAFTSATFATYFAGGMQIGSGIHKGLITNIQAAGQSQLYGAYFSNIAKKTTNGQRTAIDKARMQLLQQLVTAKLNCAAFGCTSSVQGMIAIADIAYATGTAAQIITSAGLLDAYNNSGDTIIIGNAGKATPKTSQGYANKVFWDLP